MYNLDNDWRLVVDRKVAINPNKPEERLPPIEPDYVFQSTTIAFIVQSESAKSTWYRGGRMYQAYVLPFADNGAGMGESLDVIYNRFTIYRFTQFPLPKGNTYLLSYDPPFYFKDARLKVWEFNGYEGANLESIKSQIDSLDSRTKRINTTVNRIDKKLNMNQ